MYIGGKQVVHAITLLDPFKVFFYNRCEWPLLAESAHSEIGKGDNLNIIHVNLLIRVIAPQTN